jgi:hypothetical protein
MASPRKSDDRTVARTYRAAIRIGEDFITLEETIALPIDASDEEAGASTVPSVRLLTRRSPTFARLRPRPRPSRCATPMHQQATSSATTSLPCKSK